MIAEAVAEHIGFPAWREQVQPQPKVEGPRNVQQLISGPPMDANFESVYKVPGGSALWPLSIMCRLVASGAVADRSVAIEYRTGMGLRYLVAGTQAVVQAGVTQSFCWYQDAGDVAWPIEDAAIAPLPQQHLFPGSQLALKVWNAQAGDVLDTVIISARLDAVEV